MTQETVTSRQKAAEAASQGAAAYGANDFALAESLFERAAYLDPAISSYRCNLATARLALGKAELARNALVSSLDHLEALDCATLGLLLIHLDAGAEAAAWLRRAILLDPRQASARINLGNLLASEGRHDEAITLLRQGLSETPDHEGLLNNLGLALHESGEPDAALALFDRALTQAPGQSAILLNRAHAHLLAGHWQSGFKDYEARDLTTPVSTQPRWQGEGIAGKTLLVMAEQGYGDAIQFARLLPNAARRAGRLILSCDKNLHRLFDGMCELADERASLPQHDAWCPLLSLPYLLGLDAPQIFAATPYIKAPAPLELEGDLKVGFIWAGRKGHANDKNRSLDSSLLEPLYAMPGVTSFSLQIGKGEPPCGMTNLAPIISDLFDTARAIAGLDLLISADTAPAHLAGALGQPVWTLIPYAPDWRWGLKGETTPWYPSMRLFRQSAPGDWAGVIERVATELEKAARSGNPNPSPSSV